VSRWGDTSWANQRTDEEEGKFDSGIVHCYKVSELSLGIWEEIKPLDMS
jgi:hypothetical protein